MTINGWFNEKGLLFDCINQYPLIMKKERKDLSLVLQHDAPLDSMVYRSHQNSTLYSVIIPFNEAFSHSFSTGVSMCVYMFPLLAMDNQSKVLIPSRGPFSKLFESIGLPLHRLMVADSKKSFYYSSQARLLLRKPPFNIIQAHWPAHALNDMRNRTVEWLIDNHYVKSTWPQNIVVYLWRQGLRGVDKEDEFGNLIFQLILK